LWGVRFCADATPVDSKVSPADSSTMERRIQISPLEAVFPAYRPLPLFKFAV
jgi:hypothetical protein